jgi:O-antigen ligase
VWTHQYFPALDGHWLTGYGPGTPPGITFGYTESVYLELLLRGGVILLAMYLCLMVALVAAAWPVARARRSSESRLAARVLVVLLAALVYLHLLEPYFVVTGLPHVLWVLAALAFAGGARPHGPRST